MKKTREPWLDWDNSLELAEETRQTAKSNASTKTLFWARFWLVLGLGFFSNLYLRRSLPAFLWLLVIFVYSLFSATLSEFAKGLSYIDLFLITAVNLIVYLLLITVEWIQLPKRIMMFNACVVGKNNLTSEELRGEIGRYSILKKHTYSLLIAYALSVVAIEVEEYVPSQYIFALSVCLNIIFLIFAISYIYRAHKLSRKQTN